MKDKMKNSVYLKNITFALAVLFAISVISTPAAFAADDSSIKGALRENIKASMMSFIENRMVNDEFIIFDAAKGKLLRLKFDKLHTPLCNLSCADEDGLTVNLQISIT